MPRARYPVLAAIVLLLAASAASGATRRILYVTATDGFRHSDAIDASVEVMQELARESGVLEIVHTEDISLLNADYLRNFDALYFYTSGELPLSDRQKSDVLDFVRQGKGFGGSHSATDCLYTWPEYGDLIGGYFDGHPWAQEAAVDVEDPQNPLVAHAAPGFRFIEEFYQFRAFSRDQVRVLLTLDTRSVDMGAAGINRTDGDFALAWIRNYGKGRVFYSAFGHFPDSFKLQPVRTMLLKALLWLTGEIETDATPRSGPSTPVPAIAAGGVRNLSGDSSAFAPGDIAAIAGNTLTGVRGIGGASQDCVFHRCRGAADPADLPFGDAAGVDLVTQGVDVVAQFNAGAFNFSADLFRIITHRSSFVHRKGFVEQGGEVIGGLFVAFEGVRDLLHGVRGLRQPADRPQRFASRGGQDGADDAPDDRDDHGGPAQPSGGADGPPQGDGHEQQHEVPGDRGAAEHAGAFPGAGG